MSFEIETLDKEKNIDLITIHEFWYADCRLEN